MKCLSLFSGIGGFDLACKRKGIELVGACEIDKYARQVFEQRFPGVHIYEDATQIKPKELPDFDLLVGGFPCQAFSIAGQRRGFNDTRGTLFFEIARIAREKRPRYLLLENVKGLLNHEGGETIRTIFRILDEVGYDAEWHVVNSKYYVPQNRERIFIIGHLRGKPLKPIFPIGEYGQVNNGTRQKTQGKGERVQDEISSSLQTTPHKGTATLVYLAQKNANMVNRIQERDNSWCLNQNGSEFGVIDEEPKLKPLNDARQGYRVYDKSGIGQCLNSEAGGLGAKMGLVYDDSKPISVVNDKKGLREVPQATCLDANYYKGHDYHGARTLLMSPEVCKPVLTPDREKKRQNGRRFKEDGDPAFTLTAQDKHGIYNGSKIRRLTPMECERLQGFPDGWTLVETGKTKAGKTKYMSDTQRYKMCGNAVTVDVIEDILDGILKNYSNGKQKKK